MHWSATLYTIEEQYVVVQLSDWIPNNKENKNSYIFVLTWNGNRGMKKYMQRRSSPLNNTTQWSCKKNSKACNTVGCYMSRPFAHPVVCCCLLLRVVAQSLKPVKLLNSQHCWPTSFESCCVRLYPDLLNKHTTKRNLPQGAKKVMFTTCHSGELELTFTSPSIISTSPKSVWWADWFHSSSVIWISQKTSLARGAS